MITCTVHKDAAQGKLVQAYLGYVLSTQGQLVGSKNAGRRRCPRAS